MKENEKQILEKNDLIINSSFLILNQNALYVVYAISLATLGIFYLPFYWYDKFKLFLYNETNDYDKATHVLFQDVEGNNFIVDIQTQNAQRSCYEDLRNIKFITFNQQNFGWDQDKNQWINLENIYTQKVLTEYFDLDIQPLKQETAENLQSFYGKNQVVLEIKSFFRVIVENFVTPLNIYELLLLILVLFLEEYLFAIYLAILMVIQITFDIVFYYRKVGKINEVANDIQQVNVIRIINDKEETIKINSTELVIGDIMLLNDNQKLTCDVLVIQGSCLVDQSILTGESIPVHKQQVESQQKIKSLNKIFSGSRCIVRRSRQVRVLVLKTAWNTYKGKLVGQIMNQKHQRFKLYNELKFFIILNSSLFIFIAVLQLYKSVSNETFGFKDNLLRSLEIIGDCVSPGLFFVLSTVSHYASIRMQKDDILVIDNLKIQECGRVKNVCFDKTGTLTENQVEIFGVAIKNNDMLQEPVQNIQEFQQDENHRHVVQLFACCQSLHLVNNQILGDPIEEKMFKFTGFIMKEDQGDIEVSGDHTIQIYPCQETKDLFGFSDEYYLQNKKVFKFTSDRKRMSTIVLCSQDNKEENFIYSKGAPEIMKNIFKQEDLPENYTEIVKEFSEQGLRLLAMGYKKIDDIEQDKQDLEKELDFLGFILLDNPVKPKSKEVIQTLRSKEIDCAMITGDNVYTGISIGYQTKIIDYEQDIWVGEFDIEKNKINWIFYNQVEMHHLSKIKGVNDQNPHSLYNSKISRVTSYKQNQNLSIILQNLEQDNVILALEGNAFNYLVEKYSNNEEIFDLILKRTKIYGRMIPSDKKLVVKKLKKMYWRDEYCVGFVGDGSNDSQALKEANFGLSIGNSDSQLTASFSTPIDNIEPCIKVIREGKLIIDNMVSLYQYSVYNGLIFALVIFALALNKLSVHNVYFLSEVTLYIPFYVYACYSKPSELNSFYPEVKLKTMRFAMVLYVPLIVAYILFTHFFYIMFSRETYKHPDEIIKEDELEINYIETCVLFIYINIHLVCVFVAFVRAFPYKKDLYTNKYFVYHFVIFFWESIQYKTFIWQIFMIYLLQNGQYIQQQQLSFVL